MFATTLVGCGGTDPVAKSVPTDLVIGRTVLLADEKEFVIGGQDEIPLRIGEPFILRGTLTSSARLIEALLIQIVRESSKHKEVIENSAFCKLSRDMDHYAYECSLKGLRTSKGRLVLRIRYGKQTLLESGLRLK